MNNKLIGAIFAVLFFLCMFPFAFTNSPEPYIAGWLPFPLLYWWILMLLNLVFVCWVCHVFVKNAKKTNGEGDGR